MRLFDEIIPASNVFGCLIVGSFQGWRKGWYPFLLFLRRFLAARPSVACDEAGLPALWAFGYLLSITSYYIIS